MKIVIFIIVAIFAIFISGKKSDITILGEILALVYLCNLFVRKFPKITYVISSILTFLILVNIGSLIFAGNYISYQMLSNMTALGNAIPVYLTASVLAIIVSFLPIYDKKLNKNIEKNKKIIVTSIVWFFILISYSANLNTPVKAYINTTKDFVIIKNKERKIAQENAQKRDEIIEKFTKNSMNGNIDINTEDMNLIVIFTEGLSEAVLDSNDKYADLTPNLLKFQKESYNFKNYYNHTAATYKGIRGQLFSSVQLIESYEKNGDLSKITKTPLTGLPQILKNQDYSTSFINPEPKHKDFAPYIKTLGFEDYPELDVTEKNGYKKIDSDNPYLTDEATYNLIFDEAKKKSNENKKFFISAYTLETHAGFDTDEKYKNGENQYLNKFHNMDIQFGNFMKKNGKEWSR